jgi:coproporphyrinogen III oxidase
MTLQFAESPEAKAAFALVRQLQAHLVKELNGLSPASGKSRFEPVTWLRAQGQFGGGERYSSIDTVLFNRASVNVSQVQYEKDPSRKLASASAISAIVHPRNPHAPSLHLHLSWTEMKTGTGYWRIMADLNPSIPYEAHRETFHETLSAAAGDLYQGGREQGEMYFYIPALGRHRGVAHFYLEAFSRADREKDRAFARDFGARVITCYGGLVRDALLSHPTFTSDEARRQLEYHTLYFLQVLTLDRGTTSGLLVHDENDTGILGSLPSHVHRPLLESWIPRHPALQQDLIRRLMKALPAGETVLVDDVVKVRLAEAAREFYSIHPEAQDLLAKGRVVPPTVANHR